MGRPKLLLPWGDDGRTLIEVVLAAWRAGGATYIAVTVHPDDAQLAEVCRAAGAEVVVPPQPPPDMKASVAAALAHIAERYSPETDDVWLVAPADLPQLAPTVITRLLEAFDPEHPVILRPMHAGHGGHPLLLPWSAAAALAKIPADRGLDHLFEILPHQILDAGPASLAADVDTPEDYRRLQDRHDRSSF
jgi:CTP:molybdopterin cytidylyltransferase MocA